MASSVKEWALVTSWHGVADLLRAKSWLAKGCWVLLILFTTYMFCSQVHSHLRNFTSNERDPWIETTVYELQQKIPLPILTICHMNLVSKASLTRLNMSEDAASYIVGLYRSMQGNPEDYGERVELIMRNLSFAFNNYLDENADKVKLDLYDWMLELGPDCVTTEWGIAMDTDRLKNVCDRTRKFFSEKGLCYSFEPKRADGSWMTQGAAGDEKILNFWMSQKIDDYAELTDMMAADHGISMFLGFDAVGSVFGPRIALVPGYHHWISMNFDQFKPPDLSDMPPMNYFTPSSPCVNDGRLQMIDSDSYTPGLCFKDCMAAKFYKKINCDLNPMFPINSNYKRCEIKEIPAIVKQELKIATKANLNNFEGNWRSCAANCTKSSCTGQSVSFTVTGTKSPAKPLDNLKNWEKYFGSTFGYDENSIKELTNVDVFYETMVAKVYQYQLRTSVEQLISNVGGQLGLWAGISIITLFQVLVYAMQAAVTPVIQLLHKENQKKVKSSENWVSNNWECRETPIFRTKSSPELKGMIENLDQYYLY